MAWRLPAGYRENLTRRTWEGESAGSYWHADRLALAADYQFDVYLDVRRIATEGNAQSILDVGCGPAIKAGRLFANVVSEVVLVDQPTVRGLALSHCPGATFVAADLESISEDLHRTFDVIVCSDVIEHLLDPSRCLAFLRRHAAPNSRILVSTPERDYARGVGCMACDKPEHVREWTGSEFVAMLQAEGFRVHRHMLCPTLRPEAHRSDVTSSWLEPFRPRQHGAGTDLPDRMRSCQICECSVAEPADRS
jgi:SAM-dependent methyltransferase